MTKIVDIIITVWAFGTVSMANGKKWSENNIHILYEVREEKLKKTLRSEWNWVLSYQKCAIRGRPRYIPDYNLWGVPICWFQSFSGWMVASGKSCWSLMNRCRRLKSGSRVDGNDSLEIEQPLPDATNQPEKGWNQQMGASRKLLLGIAWSFLFCSEHRETIQNWVLSPCLSSAYIYTHVRYL